MRAAIKELLTGRMVLGKWLGYKNLGGAITLKLFDLAKETDYKLLTFEESKKKLLEDHNATLNEEEGRYTFANQETEDKANADYAELLNSEVELKCRPLTMNDLDKIAEKVEIDGLTDIPAIRWAIEE